MSNSKKLQLIQEATTAFPGTPVNSAIWYYLRNLYSDNGSVAGLISRYLRSDSTPPTPTIRWAYNFDGVDDRGQLQFRAINPDGDIDIEWTQIGVSNVGGSPQIIVTQSLSATIASREFVLRWNGNSGGLQLSVGGAGLVLAVPCLDGKYRIIYSGETYTVFYNGVLSGTGSFTRGTVREPTAVTLVGCRNNAGSFTEFVLGRLYDVRINGVLYPIADRNQAIQLPQPSGLGPELITQSVLENPFVKGSQWTYLGDGRWQLIGDGNVNTLEFFAASGASQPVAGYFEFEIESISGTLTCAVSASGTDSPATFNTIGVKRYFYTKQGNTGNPTNGNLIQLKRLSGAVNCVIKNISFKPLWVASSTELVTNGSFTSSAGWTVGPYTTISGSACRIELATEATSTTRPVVVDGTKQYLLSYTVTEHSTGSVRVSLFANGTHYLGVDRITTGAYTELVTFNRSGGSFTNTIAVQGGYAGVSTAAITGISLREITTICNPLTLVNTASTGWQEINV